MRPIRIQLQERLPLDYRSTPDTKPDHKAIHHNQRRGTCSLRLHNSPGEPSQPVPTVFPLSLAQFSISHFSNLILLPLRHASFLLRRVRQRVIRHRQLRLRSCLAHSFRGAPAGCDHGVKLESRGLPQLTQEWTHTGVSVYRAVSQSAMDASMAPKG